MSNCVWRFNSRFGMVYLEDRKLVEKVAKLKGIQSKIDDAVMATYLSPGGRTFAWQIMFEMAMWERVRRISGVE